VYICLLLCVCEGFARAVPTTHFGVTNQKRIIMTQRKYRSSTCGGNQHQTTTTTTTTRTTSSFVASSLTQNDPPRQTVPADNCPSEDAVKTRHLNRPRSAGYQDGCPDEGRTLHQHRTHTHTHTHTHSLTHTHTHSHTL